jgi:hypothetical protein
VNHVPNVGDPFDVSNSMRETSLEEPAKEGEIGFVMEQESRQWEEPSVEITPTIGRDGASECGMMLRSEEIRDMHGDGDEIEEEAKIAATRKLCKHFRNDCHLVDGSSEELTEYHIELV